MKNSISPNSMLSNIITNNDFDIFIFSWKKVTSNALSLYNQVIKVYPNTIFINCDENFIMPPKMISSTIQLDDSYYYGGQFETAINKVSNNRILCCITGDISPNADWNLICKNSIDAFNKNNIGIYAPDIDNTFHIAKGNLVYNQIYQVPNTDCTCWFIAPSIYQKLLSIPYYSIANYGWGIDEIFCAESIKQKLLVVRDYSVMVTNPISTGYNKDTASLQQQKLIDYYNLV